MFLQSSSSICFCQGYQAFTSPGLHAYLFKYYLRRGANSTTPKCVSLTGGLFQADCLRNRRLRRFFLLPPKTPLYQLKEFRKRACSCNRAIPDVSAKNMGWAWQRRLYRAWRSESTVSPCLCRTQQALAFPFPCELPPFALKAQTATPNILSLSLTESGI